MRAKRVFPLLTILFITLSLAGCSPHRSELQSSLIEVPASYTGHGQEPSSPVGRWWEKFDDDTLNSLMEEAFRNNLDIAKAYARMEQAMAALNITNSSRGVNITISGSGGKARQPGITSPVTSETYSLSAAAQYEIDLWGKLKSNANAARFDLMASQEDLKALFISVSAQIADLYYLAVEQRAQLDLSDRTIASFQDTLSRVERRYRSGLIPAIDVYQSRQNLASARAQRPAFASSLAVTLNALSILAGRFPDRKIGGDSSSLIVPHDLAAGIPSQLLERRPDIEAALFRLEADDERIGAAVADRFPSFTLTGAYGGASDRLRTLLDTPNIFWNILLEAAQPVIDSGRRKYEVERRRAVFREHLVDYHKTVLTAFKEVEDALTGIESSEERIRMLSETVSVSENSLRLALDRYLQGLTDYLPVLTEQLRHFTAQSNLLSARRQLISQRIQLARAIGGEWTNPYVKQYTSYKKEHVQ